MENNTKTEEYKKKIYAEKLENEKKAEVVNSQKNTPAVKKYKKQVSAVPIYFVALFTILWAVFLPFYKFSNFLAWAFFSFVLYWLGRLIWRSKKVPVEEATPVVKENKKEALKSTGDPDIDALRDEAIEAVNSMEASKKGIKDSDIRLNIAHLQDVTERIVDKLIEDHSRKSEVRRFFNYYLPTTIKLVEKYNEIDDLNNVGENISNTKADLEEMILKLREAYDRQLDALYGKDALDISTEIKVMESLLKREGLL